jgi:hypothetical protein
VTCCISAVLLGILGCNRHTDRSAAPRVVIVGRWESTDDDPENGTTVWEFTKDGTVKASSGREVGSTATFRFLDDETLEIAWEDMETVTYKVRVANDELECRPVSIDLGDGPRPADGRTTTMTRANP